MHLQTSVLNLRVEEVTRDLKVAWVEVRVILEDENRGRTAQLVKCLKENEVFVCLFGFVFAFLRPGFSV